MDSPVTGCITGAQKWSILHVVLLLVTSLPVLAKTNSCGNQIVPISPYTDAITKFTASCDMMFPLAMGIIVEFGVIAMGSISIMCGLCLFVHLGDGGTKLICRRILGVFALVFFR